MTTDRRADDAIQKIWTQWLAFYLKHNRGNVLISMADQQAFYEIAQPIMRELVGQK